MLVRQQGVAPTAPVLRHRHIFLRQQQRHLDAPTSRQLTWQTAALPDPQHEGSHHEQDEASLLVREQLFDGDLEWLQQQEAEEKQRQHDHLPDHMRRAATPGASHHIADIANMAEGDEDKHKEHGEGRFRPQIMGLDVTPELFAIAMVYLVQGILGLSRLALSFYFKDDLHVEPAQVAVLTGIANMPW